MPSYFLPLISNLGTFKGHKQIRHSFKGENFCIHLYDMKMLTCQHLFNRILLLSSITLTMNTIINTDE